MSSAECALSLIDRTEANLKRIEELQSAFVVPVLNEYSLGGRDSGRALSAVTISRRRVPSGV